MNKKKYNMKYEKRKEYKNKVIIIKKDVKNMFKYDSKR